MTKQIQRIVIVGGGSAGFLIALGMRRSLPEVKTTVLHSPDIPVIGVGESTTNAVPIYLHQQLGIDRRQFYDAVRPGWKLGIKFIWGDPRDSHFHYPFERGLSVMPPGCRRLASFFQMDGVSTHCNFAVMMDENRSPCIRTPNGEILVEQIGGYHIENKSFIAFIHRKSIEAGAEVLDGTVAQVNRGEDGDVVSLGLKDGRIIEGDLFIDCTGFASVLLGKTMGGKYRSFSDSLFCDTAVVGSWKRTAPVYSYTTCETMDHGWAWRIEFPEHVTRGYVFSSQFCTFEQAREELMRKNPEIPDTFTVKFKSGRYEDFWIGNVAAVGNASGFVEPLEATALHVIIEQSRIMARVIAEGQRSYTPAARAAANRRVGNLWDDIRNFLAIHYRFNRRLDTPFWRHCRENTNLGGAEPLIEMYRQSGPAALCEDHIPRESIFGYEGFLTLIQGQRVATDFQPQVDESEWKIWRSYQERFRMYARQALPMPEAIKLIFEQNYQWRQRGW